MGSVEGRVPGFPFSNQLGNEENVAGGLQKKDWDINKQAHTKEGAADRQERGRICEILIRIFIQPFNIQMFRTVWMLRSHSGPSCLRIIIFFFSACPGAWRLFGAESAAKT